ncbi:MAG TPA: hypothetical protein VGS41_00705 [Chthonomonadales bacterium]|nr:hypothetical protein [Chthonomonadales bacterium]
MRFQVSLAILVLLPAIAVRARAISPDQETPEQQSIEALEARITTAQPREQCILYAQLIQKETEYSLQQYSAGDVQKGNALLRHVQLLAHRLHLSVAMNDKQLKNAEILLRRTAFRLTEMLHSSDYDTRPLVAQTLAQVNEADNEAMMQVFKK